MLKMIIIEIILNLIFILLKKEMYKEAEALNFEKAAKLRDEISDLEKNELNVK